MEDNEVKKYAKLAISMSTDFLSGGITAGTYITNVETISKKLGPGPTMVEKLAIKFLESKKAVLRRIMKKGSKAGQTRNNNASWNAAEDELEALTIAVLVLQRKQNYLKPI